MPTFRIDVTALVALMLTLLLAACVDNQRSDASPREATLAEAQEAAPIAVLNMSRDLARLGIASQNLLPDQPALDAVPLLQAALNFSARNRVRLLTLDTGSYYLLTAVSTGSTLDLYQLSDMTIDFAGSKIFFNGPLLPNGLHIAECSGLVLTNFSIDYLHPPYTHVRITSVDPQRRSIEFEPLPGWPDPSSFNGIVGPWGSPITAAGVMFRDGSVLPGTSRTHLVYPFRKGVVDLIQDDAPWSQAETLSTLRPGDTLAVTIRGGGQPILLEISNGVTLSKIDIHGSPAWAVGVFSSSNITVDSVRVLPRPGTGLIGSNGDGIHFAWSLGNNHIRNAFVSRTMDDALIMDSPHLARINAQSGRRQLQLERRALRFPNGTEVNFVDPATAVEIRGGVIVAQDPPDTKFPVSGQVTLTFDRDLAALPAGAGMVYAAPTLRGQGSSIEDSVVEDTFGGRGIWLNGVRGVTVQNNIVRRTSQGGIVLQQSTDAMDLGSFGPPSQDILVKANTLDGNLGPAAEGTGSQNSLASIVVLSTNNAAGGFAAPAGPVNVGISIVDNVISNSGRAGIWMGQVDGGSVRGNRIERVGVHSERPIWGLGGPFAEQVRLDAVSRIVIRHSTNVVTDFNPADCLFEWAERHYGGLFAPTSASQEASPWYYRYYSGTNAYLGISSLDNQVYYLSGGMLSNVGASGPWFAMAGCR